MKFLVQCVVAASLFCAVAAVTYTKYTDLLCATPVPGSSNPETVGINKCVSISGQSFYQKIHACATGGKVAGAQYTDSACSAKKPNTDFDYDVGKCMLIEGGGSQKITCDPASSLSVAFLAVFASVLAMCVF
jgi:hypothetical protein